MRALALAVLVAAVNANADVIISSEADCAGKDAGAACTSWTLGEKNGVCQPAKCSRKDYSQGVPPKTKWIDCLKCERGSRDGGVPEGYGTAPKKETKK